MYKGIGKKFLSSNAQDFIEDQLDVWQSFQHDVFLSSNAQDFIEDKNVTLPDEKYRIPEQ